MTDRTIIANVSATKGKRAVRKLARYGILSKFDADTKSLTVLITTAGERVCRDYAYAALESTTENEYQNRLYEARIARSNSQ